MRGTWDLVLLVYLYVFTVMGVSHYLRKHYSAETTRRIVHILASDIIIVLPLFASLKWVIIIPVGLAIIVAVGIAFGLPIRESLVPKEDDPVHAYGPVYYIISIALLIALFGIKSYIPIVATFVMAWGDGFAALIGKRFGKHRLINGKTLEGSLAMFLFALAGALFGYYFWAYLGGALIEKTLRIALISAASGSIIELLSIGKLRSFDNFTVPLGVAFVLSLI
jgi:phytol kinase